MKRIDEAVNNGSYAFKGSIGVLTFLPAGVQRLNDWADGTAVNYGMSMWSTDPHPDTSVWDIRAGTTELVGGEPILELTITPEPATMGLLGLGLAGLAALRRRRRK